MYVYTSILVPPVPVGILVTQRLGWAAHDSWNNPFMLFICVCAFVPLLNAQIQFDLLSITHSLRSHHPGPQRLSGTPLSPPGRAHVRVALLGKTCLGPTSCARAVGTAAPECPRDLILISFGRGDARTAARAHMGGPCMQWESSGAPRCAARASHLCLHVRGCDTPPPGTGGAPRLGHIGRDGAWVGVRARPRRCDVRVCAVATRGSRAGVTAARWAHACALA